MRPYLLGIKKANEALGLDDNPNLNRSLLARADDMFTGYGLANLLSDLKKETPVEPVMPTKEVAPKPPLVLPWFKRQPAHNFNPTHKDLELSGYPGAV